MINRMMGYARFTLAFIGLIVLMGAEGGLQQDTLTIAQGVVYGVIGLAMMGVGIFGGAL